MIATNTTTPLLANAEPLSRGNGKGADVVNNGKTANPIIAHKQVSTIDRKSCQPAKATKTAKKPAAPRKKRYDEEDLIAFGENACMLRGAAEALLDLFHALHYHDDDQKEIVNGVKVAFQQAADIMTNAADIFEEGISHKILSKRKKTMSTIVNFDVTNMDALIAFSAINSGCFQWIGGAARIEESCSDMASILFESALKNAANIFRFTEEAISNPALAATLASMKGGAR